MFFSFSKETAAQLLFDLGKKFKEGFAKIRRELVRGKFKLELRQRIYELAATLSSLMLAAGVVVWVIRRTVSGIGTLGDLALFYQVFNQGQSIVRSFLGDVNGLYSNSLFLGDLFEYLDLKPQITSSDCPAPIALKPEKEIVFENVTFHYQNNPNEALVDFNLVIPAGKTVAVVSENGAGKSTLIKLLCRFYDPQKGAVKLDGVDLKEFALTDLRGAMTVLFQSPVHYNDTIKEIFTTLNIVPNVKQVFYK